jgi:hypothetical protein
LGCGCKKDKATEPSKTQQMIDSVKSKVLVDEEVTAQRLEICSTCEFYEKATDRCKQCGCFMKFKARLKKVKCPVGKWE